MAYVPYFRKILLSKWDNFKKDSSENNTFHKNIPLTESLALIGREASKQAIKDFLGLPDADK
ncbi:MAG: hypothetical protein COT85_00875 [Chlamydiae bacterium CG10_big_fil_rev_8_21_14_0_10_42_34]|nr:MAG: hypothetical protein COT85_00875 [Chlamydiae bacterium CG10_big_fil_rev_8_21_14_0_10_42_34]